MGDNRNNEEFRSTRNETPDDGLEDAYLPVNLETMKANRALYDEEDIRYFIELYGYSPFQICKRKAGPETFACYRVRVSAEEAALNERVNQWSARRSDREKKSMQASGISVESLDSLLPADEEDSRGCYEIPDPQDLFEELLQKERYRALVAALEKEKPYYTKILGWLYLNCCTPTLVARELNIPKTTAHRDIQKVRKIGAEVLRRFESAG